MGEKTKQGPTEWPTNPPLPPREVDPTGTIDEMRKIAGPGDDTVFEANAEPPSRRSKKAPPKTENDHAAPASDDDAQRSRTER